MKKTKLNIVKSTIVLSATLLAVMFIKRYMK